jgi:hypothetical protein
LGYLGVLAKIKDWHACQSRLPMLLICLSMVITSHQPPSQLNIIGLAVCVVADVAIIAVPPQHIRRE